MISERAAAVVCEVLRVGDLFPSPWKFSNERLPTDGDQFVAVRPGTDVTDGTIQKTGETVIHYGVQILVRARDSDTAFRKASAIVQYIQQKRDAVTVNGKTFRVVGWSLTTPPSHLTTESQNQREVWVTNGLATIKEGA